MAGQSIAIATKGIIFCPIPIIRRCVLPLALSITPRITELSIDPKDSLFIDLVRSVNKQLDIKLTTNKLDIVKKRIINIDIKKCED